MWLKLILAWLVASVLLGSCLGALIRAANPDR
jgi:hypothetical protein